MNTTNYDSLDFDQNDGYLKRLNLDAEKEEVRKHIVTMNGLIPGQPFFFISRDSWEMLAKGETLDGRGRLFSWLEKKYGPEWEVAGFVFCLAFDRDEGHNPCDRRFGMTYAREIAGKAFFRVRTLVRKVGAKDKGVVETDFIAFADTSIGLHNYMHAQREDCLVFVNPLASDNAKRLKDRIDSMVYEKRDPAKVKVPDSFVDITPPCDPKKIRRKEPLENEGGIFGRQKIWNELLVDKYGHVEGVLVSIAIKPGSTVQDPLAFYFDFKINDEYVTNKPCPIPQICQTPS